MSPEWWVFGLGIIAGLGLLLVVLNSWHCWRDRLPREPQIASEAERWLEERHDGARAIATPEPAASDGTT
jgi:hypothetical protein